MHFTGNHWYASRMLFRRILKTLSQIKGLPDSCSYVHSGASIHPDAHLREDPHRFVCPACSVFPIYLHVCKDCRVENTMLDHHPPPSDRLYLTPFFHCLPGMCFQVGNKMEDHLQEKYLPVPDLSFVLS